MVFPVFARARESARKAVCLSNTKNIALAIQMYLADNNDTLFPTEHRQETVDYFDTYPGGGDWWDGSGDCGMELRANPYLRPAVLLDEYTKNRDVWRCPSAKIQGAAYTILPGPDWLGYLKSSEGVWGANSDPHVCVKDNVYPPGWGGVVTDSIKQQRAASEWPLQANAVLKVFVWGISMNECYDVKLTAVQDATNRVICADAGFYAEWVSPGMIAYPDFCALECGNCWGWADWDACASTAGDCGLYTIAPSNGSFLRDEALRKPFTRHLGGSNMGFLDGHAAWMSAGKLLAGMSENKDGYMGLYAWGPTSANTSWTGQTYDKCGFTAGGQPILY